MIMVQCKIVQISDTHLTPAGAKPANHQRLDPEEKLRTVFDDIYNTNVDPDLIVISGDLIHEGDAEAYADFHHMLDQEQERLMAPIKVILGNHDRTDQFYKGFLGKKRVATRYYYHESLEGLECYFLDTKCGDIEQGYLDQTQLQWLKNQLQEYQRPGIIFMHHPLYGPPLQQMRYSILQNGDDLLNVIDHTHVKAIFSGHVHFANSYVVDDILNVVADSTAYHINCANPHEHFVTDGTAYNVITVDGDDIGVEQRLLYLGTKTINAFKIPNTDFVDKKILTRAWSNVLSKE
ncbi:MAG: metallophosphoesterase [Lentilactobacillus hilgardii]|uniref:metallophosphoesterase family protein n=1 Tax=Lentilactobacillus hilgardii TaxID=1588 RepID=UPI001E1AA785|nr:metallophosphoesterase [Lentilactobacillus hilgardii]MBZ2200188.1 metallophosphoesterase [Lentilactobacillus hilgardii]MBZ2203229.1 metallophosphoesterase [Lentilactobacillus hilgardii]